MPEADSTYAFDFYERVHIVGECQELTPIRGEPAAILGRAEGIPELGYAVWIYSKGECWSVTQSDLESTGEFDQRETFYPGESVRVIVSADGRAESH